MNEELVAFSSLGDVVQWMGDALLQDFRQAAGDVRLLREIVLIPSLVWDAAVAATSVAFPAQAAEEPAPDPPDRAPTALEFGIFASLRRVAMSRMGLPPEEAGGRTGRGPPAAERNELGGGAAVVPVGTRRRRRRRSGAAGPQGQAFAGVRPGGRCRDRPVDAGPHQGSSRGVQGQGVERR